MEQALPMLKNLFDNSGMQLGEVTIQDNSYNTNQGEQQSSQQHPQQQSKHFSQSSPEMKNKGTTFVRNSESMVDYYA